MPKSKVNLPENIHAAVAMKIEHDFDAIIPLLIDTNEIAEQFLKVKKACKLIDSYARGSIYPIVGFAFSGFRTTDTDDVTDTKLKSSPIVARWLNAVQYCQGVTLILPMPNMEISESLATEVSNIELDKQLEPKSFEQADQFEENGDDLQVTFPLGSS